MFYHLPLWLLFTSSIAYADPAPLVADCVNRIATSEKVYCLTSRGTPVTESPTASQPADVSLSDEGVVYDDGELVPTDVQHYEEYETTDHISHQ